MLVNEIRIEKALNGLVVYRYLRGNVTDCRNNGQLGAKVAKQPVFAKKSLTRGKLMGNIRPRCQAALSVTATSQNRRVAQFGSALGLGPRGRWFESSLADHFDFRVAGMFDCARSSAG